MKLSSILDRTLTCAAVGAVALLLFTAFRPNGTLGRAYRAWQNEKEASAAIRSNWQALASDVTRLNAHEGEIQVIEFSDYQCPFCRQQHAALTDSSIAQPSSAIGYRHLPSERHPAARLAAVAAICAEEQGRFAHMHDRLFLSMQWQSDLDFLKVALEAGVPDTAMFQECLVSPRPVKRLEDDIAWAKKLSISATPTFVTLGGLHVGFTVPAKLDSLGSSTK